jgi:signal transduction histidine kinase
MSLIDRVAALPLARRFALYVSVLLVVVVGVVLAVAYGEIRSNAEMAERERLTRVAQRMATLVEDLFLGQVRASHARALSDPAITAVLLDPTPERQAHALAVLDGQGRGRSDGPGRGRGDGQGRWGAGNRDAYGLWRITGRRVAGVGSEDSSSAELRRDGIFSRLETAAGDTLRVGPIRLEDGALRFWVASTVRDSSGAMIGLLAEKRRLMGGGDQGRRMLQFLGVDKPILLMNHGANIAYSTEGDSVTIPPYDSTKVLTYDHGGVRAIAGVGAIRGGTWTVLVELPYDEALARVQSQIRKLVGIAVGLGLLCIAVAWLVGQRLGTPLTALAGAAEGIASGNYAKRVGMSGDDELGRLGGAFDLMAGRVEAASNTQQFLEEASRLLANSLVDDNGLRELTEMCVPRMADWCSVHLLSDAGGLDRVETAHRDLSKASLVREMFRLYPYSVTDAEGAPVAVRTQSPLFVPVIPPSEWDRAGKDETHRDMIRALRPSSYISVPLVARGRVLGALSFVMSDSERTYTDQDLAVATELARRTAIAIDNARLYRTSVLLRLDAESANRAKSDFLATMSHEIRTPINAMIGYAELLDMGVNGPLSDRQRESVNRIRSSGTHLTALVDDILDLTKIEARQFEITRVAALASEAIERAISLVRPQAAAKGVALVEADAATVGVRYFGDPRRVQQVLSNLLSNAVKFTPSGGQVRVSYGMGPMPDGVSDAAGPAAYVSVSDTGIGIDPSDLERVFQPFVQLNSGYTRPAGGTGLGLAICRSLAGMMGGTITVDSARGAGSTFTLWLPLATHGKPRVSKPTTSLGAG